MARIPPPRVGAVRTHMGRRGMLLSTSIKSATLGGARRGFASAEVQAPVKRKGFVRRLVLPTALLTGVAYGAGTYAALENDKFHDFFVERIPGGEHLVTYFSDSHLDNLTSYTSSALQKAKSTLSNPEERVKKATTAMQREMEASKERAKEGLDVVKSQVEGLGKWVVEETQQGKEKVQGKAGIVKAKADQTVTSTKDVVQEASNGVEKLVTKAESGLKASSSSPSVDAATPSKPALPAYPGEIPLGFEAPPGYSGSAPRPRNPTTEKGGKDLKTVAQPAAPPLPLVAPAVRELSASEPVLGQLAATIDSLAGFLRDLPAAAPGGKSTGDSGTAKDVLTTAELDLKNLGKRLEGIKAEERAALEQKLDAQAKEYSGLLLQAERELHSRLDQQESDWKTAFDTERQALVQAYKRKLEGELDTQQEIINQRLKEEVINQGIEMQRRWVREIKLRVEQERGGRLAKLEELEGGVRKLERVTLDNEEYLDENLRVNRLWNALRAVGTVVGKGEKSSLEESVRALKIAAEKKAPTPVGVEGEDSPAAIAKPDLVATALSTIPNETLSSGINTPSFLTQWFLTSVKPSIQSAALLPPSAGIESYAASWVFSKLLFGKQGLVEGDDVVSVLSRVEWLLERKRLGEAVGEVNALQGWAKVLARDWLEASRRCLEVQQALQLAETEARLESLLL